MASTPQSLGYDLIECVERINVWEDKVVALLGMDADVTLRNEEGKTALMVAAERGHVRVMELLLGAGADIDAADKDGRTALIWATHHSSEAALFLIGRGAKTHIRDKHNGCALLYAVRQGEEEIVRVLLGTGIDVCAKDKDGKSMLDLAEEMPEYYKKDSAIGILRDVWRRRQLAESALRDGMPIRKDIAPLQRLQVRKRGAP